MMCCHEDISRSAILADVLVMVQHSLAPLLISARVAFGDVCQIRCLDMALADQIARQSWPHDIGASKRRVDSHVRSSYGFRMGNGGIEYHKSYTSAMA